MKIKIAVFVAMLMAMVIVLSSCINVYRKDEAFANCNVCVYRADSAQDLNIVTIKMSTLFDKNKISLIRTSVDYGQALVCPDITHKDNGIKNLCDYFDGKLEFIVSDQFDVPANTIGARMRIHYWNGEVITVYYSTNELYIWTGEYQYFCKNADLIDGEELCKFVLYGGDK